LGAFWVLHAIWLKWLLGVAAFVLVLCLLKAVYEDVPRLPSIEHLAGIEREPKLKEKYNCICQHSCFVIDAKQPLDKQCPKADPWFYVVMADEMPEPMKEGKWIQFPIKSLNLGYRADEKGPCEETLRTP
jgi:hypothetical protein